MNIQKFREVINKRAATSDEYEFGVEQCWKEEIALLMEDIASSIEFLKNDCTADEFSWISEVLDDIAERTGSEEFVECYKSLMLKFPEECIKYNIAGSIKFAEAALGVKGDGKKN